ncbi:hypothetical protein [Kribbella deserti]|uniref:DUF1795 domain-containing protein n=1 Tax=Kribbella deserti TaxID=1926257 RepID=A0ABV6QR57_9ACTN
MRTAAAVLGIMVLGGGSGYAAAHFTLPEDRSAAGRRPQASAPVTPTPTPTPTPAPSSPRTRYPIVPPKMPALELDDIVFVGRRVTLTGELESSVSLEVPRGWGETIQAEGDVARFTKPGPDPRFIRVQAGFHLVETPLSRATRARREVIDSLTYENDPKFDELVSGSMTGVDGVKRSYQDFRYSYISKEQGLKLVILRHLAFEGNPNTAVVMAVAGMPKDEKALAAVLNRATKTVARSN